MSGKRESLKQMFKNRAILLAILFLTAIIPVKAQHMQASLSHYSTDDGLASNAIANIAQDDYGYIWLATWNGLSRFDGYHFFNYRTGNASHIPNLHNRLSDIVIDQSQNVWMRMYDGRIFIMYRQEDRIINPFENVAGSEEYRTSSPLFVMNNGDVLAGIDGVGMYKMRLDNGKADMRLITTSSMTVYSIAEGYHDDIWVGTDKGLHRIDIGNLSIERKGLFEDEEVTALYSNGFNVYVGCRSGSMYMYSYGQEPRQIRSSTGIDIQCIYVDSKGIIWFCDDRLGATRLIENPRDEKHFQQIVLAPEFDGRGGKFVERDGTVWMQMNHGGYGYYNRETDEVEYFHNDPSNPWNLSNTVNAVCELSDGVIFMSTSRRALEKLEILKNTITRTRVVATPELPADNEIRGMLYDKRHKLLMLGNKNNALFIYKSDGSRTVVNQDSNGNPIGRIYGISQDRKGDVWLSSKDNGLFKMTFTDGSSFTIKNYRHSQNDKFSLSSNAAYQTLEDKDGNIWIATYGGGVNVMTKDKDGRSIFLNAGNEMRKYPHKTFMKVRTIAIDNNGVVWAGTTDGILLLTLKDHKVNIERLENSTQNPDDILMSTDVVCLARDSKGSMWVGTNGGGLSHTTGQDRDGAWLFETLGSANGLPSEEIRSITFDKNDNVWFATDHIICSYNQSNKILTTFSNLDGVDETMSSEGAAITLPNGNILFGTLDGYYTVDRKKLITNNTSMLKLRITDFFINDKIVSPRFDSYYTYYVPDSREVRLPSHGTDFAFRFISLNYQLQHRMHYQYMLEGYDKQWLNAGKERMAKYSGVPTGTYRFKVKAFLQESPDKFDMKIIEVTIPPYFLLSSHAVWLYMAILLVLSILLMFWRQNKLKKQQKLKILKLGPMEMAFVRQEDYDFVKSQLDWLESHYADSALKTEDMVTQSNLGRVAYTEQMKELTGQTPKEFIADFRMKKAIMFLENTDLSIAEIAFKTGFVDSVSFTRTFKQKTDMTPTKYREQKKQEQKAASKNEKSMNQENQHEKEKNDEYEQIDD